MTPLPIGADAYLHLARIPIMAENPFGTDIRYSPEYERLERELGKSSALYAAGEVDWEQVRSGCETLLREHSKDLRVAAWLTWALYRLHALDGLNAGLGLVLELCSQQWDGLFPGKPRTRLAALGWLLPRLEQALGEPHAAVDPALPEQLDGLLRQLDDCLAERLGDQAPTLLPLRRQLQELRRQAPPASPAPTPVTPAAPTASPGRAPQNDKDAQKTLRTLQEQARVLCDWWLSRNPTDSRALRLSRCLLWLPIEALPPCNQDKVTTLRGLPGERLNHFQDLINQGRHAELLIQLEISLARAPFWLDGQYLAWQCLQSLNAKAAMQALESELAALLRRLPGLEALRFHDGTPFAGPAALAWMGGHVLSSAPAASEPPVTATDAPWEAGLRQAQTLLHDQGLRAAVQWLRTGQQTARGLREQAYWELAQARLCRQAGRHELARALLEALDQDLRTHGLEHWEPELALAITRQLHGCYEQQGLRERKEELYRRLCRLDLDAALN
ncbi:type VI secretion system protein TssA [Pseudomonas flexibilis]|uniref:ImpA N-terminal domain-containing protein n=1 Tax=Pseudomonas flexibilis TaxID=706570 RepID=A0A0B3BKD1_9PSED|nr:type VI secretion system protein TssA [Pseudomonas flexibilis]KHO64928.1 hypothetical protein PT85_12195 [Pseudomonas flexibilis]SCX94587.1 type VI secretion system protein VasJ [Pseudomonas flexibilis]